MCKRFYDADRVVPTDVLDALPHAMAGLERSTGRTFGGGPRPLLVSVRSGAAISMPGMMDTVLNLGMTDEVSAALAVSDPDYGSDTRRRFIDQLAKVVGRAAPQHRWDQLHAAIEAVFSSALRARAVAPQVRGYPRRRGHRTHAGAQPAYPVVTCRGCGGGLAMDHI